MRYFFDTEFLETGGHDPIYLISIGMVSEDGRELYCICNDYPVEKSSQWLIDNVLPYIDWKDAISRQEIANKIIGFVGTDPSPEFWANFADYDWVVFCQIFGTMMEKPEGFPKFCMDIQQLAKMLGFKEKISKYLPKEDEHHALADARWDKAAYDFLMKRFYRGSE